MWKLIRPALVLFIVLTVITGVVYPLAVHGISQAVFPRQANGSVIVNAEGQAVGSSLIGQAFTGPQYFWGRPSATGPVPYTAFNGDKGTSSSGSNQGPTNPDMLKAVADRVAALKAADPANTRPIPVDLVTASASGLDPHISPAAAEYQVARVARARNMSEDDVRRLVAAHTTGRLLGVLGEPVVNVLPLNRALDAAGSKK